MNRLRKHRPLTLLLIILMFVTSIKLNAQTKPCENKLSIFGNTNISQFRFKQTSFANKPDDKRKKSWRIEESGDAISIYIPVNDFKTNNPIMYFNFLDLIKAEQYPDIIISLQKKELFNISNTEKEFVPLIVINLAGVKKEYLISCESASCQKTGLHIKGSREIKLTDFKLNPPTKSLGLIKVKNNVIINFELSLPVTLLSSNTSGP